MGGDDDDTRLPPSNPNESSDGNWSIYSLEVPISGEPLCLLRVCNATMYMLLYIPYLRYLHTLLSKSSIFSIAEEFICHNDKSTTTYMCHTVITSCTYLSRYVTEVPPLDLLWDSTYVIM